MPERHETTVALGCFDCWVSFLRSGQRRRRGVSRRSLRYMLPAALLLTGLAGGGFAALETDTVESYWEGLWWALSLVTTVGFTGEAPATGAGRILSGILMIVGFLLLAMTTAAVASLFVLEDEQSEEEKERAFEREVLEELRAMRHRYKCWSGIPPPPTASSTRSTSSGRR